MSTNKKPLVSIVMPVFNAESFLIEAIESIIKQTYDNYEFIIVNDNSSDSSWRIIQEYQKIYPKKIKTINLKRTLNSGGDAPANLGIKLAKGKYIARMDADDISYPTRIEKQVNFLEKNKNIFIVGASANIINKSGSIIGTKNVPLTNSDIFRQYALVHPMIHPTVMFRNRTIKTTFFYQNKYSANNDYYTFFKLINKGYQFANLPEKLIKYRIYGNNNSLKNIKKTFLNTLKIRLYIFNKFSYKYSFIDLIKIFAQTLIVFSLPETMLKTIYLYSRGILNKQIILNKINSYVNSLKKHAIRPSLSFLR